MKNWYLRAIITDDWVTPKTLSTFPAEFTTLLGTFETVPTNTQIESAILKRRSDLDYAQVEQNESSDEGLVVVASFGYRPGTRETYVLFARLEEVPDRSYDPNRVEPEILPTPAQELVTSE